MRYNVHAESKKMQKRYPEEMDWELVATPVGHEPRLGEREDDIFKGKMF